MTLRKYLDPAFGVFFIVIIASIFNNYLQNKNTSLSEQDLLTQAPVVSVLPTQAATKEPVNPTKAITQRTPSPTAKVAQAPAKTCIVTINGKRYDVERLRRTHSGGDVFVCNTDMTRTFKSQHGADYRLISPYLL